MGSKNVGQVSGMFVGITPPDNIKMIWWDSTPSQLCHKIYDYNLKQWVILNQGILSTITYNELKNLALSVGLSVGKFYVITDKGNILSLAITRTKIQYVDLSGNLLVDDLGSNILYYVSSNNLTIDGENGTFSEDGIKLNFVFVEDDFSNASIESSYLYGKNLDNLGKETMVKFKLKSIVSSQEKNDLSWNSGLYFNFSDKLLSLGDKKGGVVLYDSYVTEQDVIKKSIRNISDNYNTIIDDVSDIVIEETSDEKILSKRISELQTSGEPTDAIAGDTIYTVLSKFQRFINKFKYATGIRLSKNFNSNAEGKVNSNDTVETAISKLQNQSNNVKLSLPSDWVPNAESGKSINPGDSFDLAIGKIEADRKKIRDLETTLSTVNLEYYSGAELKYSELKYRIFNGILEIRNEKWVKLEIVYTRTIVQDKTRFFKISFPSSFVNKILPFLPIPITGDYSDLNSLSLSNIGQISLSKVIKSDDGINWESPDISLLASFNFAYSQRNSSEAEERLGISLSPVSMCKVSGGAIVSPYEINEEITFQTLLTGNFSCRFYLPPFVLQYKLF